MKSAGGGGSSAPSGTAPVTHDELCQVLKSLSDAIQDLHVSKRSGGKTSGRLYCYKHGYGIHKGLDCSFMKNQPGVYSDAMLKSMSPSMVAGGAN